MSAINNTQPPHRRRFSPLVLAAGAGSVVALSLSMTGTLSGFTASIANSVNTAASGTLVMQEQNAAGTVTCLSTDGGSVSTNAATCATINKYGGSTTLVPGTPVPTSITIKNVGTVPASTFSLTPGTCTQTNNGTPNGSALDFCTKLAVVIKSGATSVFSGTATSLATGGAITLPAGIAPVAPGASVPFTFTVTLDAAAGNPYQGLAASQPLTWAFAS